jgi:c(7)-type cytochrome triheme protein
MKYHLFFAVLVLSLLFQNSASAVTVRDVVYSTKNAGKVVFTHDKHLHTKETSNNCRACHDALFDLKKKKQFSMADMGKGRSCGACHTGAKAFALKECARCHRTKEIVYKVAAAGPTVFSHTAHLATSPDCLVCHPALFAAGANKRVTMAAMEKGRSCGACHTGKKAFALKECSRCHPTKEIVFKVAATGPTAFSHSSHLGDTPDCKACHPTLFATGSNKRITMAAMEKGRSCGTCHNGIKAFGVRNCVNCHPVKDVTYTVKETGPTQFRHTTHFERTSCSACHPKLYTPNKKNTPVGMAAMKKGKSCGACHNSKQAFPIKECTKCHPTQEVEYTDTGAGTVVFSHRIHKGLYGCGECHTKLYATTRSSVKVSMKEMEAGKSCGSCHDGKNAISVKEKCDSCHRM